MTGARLPGEKPNTNPPAGHIHDGIGLSDSGPPGNIDALEEGIRLIFLLRVPKTDPLTGCTSTS